MLEIYWNQAFTVLMVEDLEKSEVKRIDELDYVQLQKIDAAVANSRPGIYKDLCDAFGYGPQHAYPRVYNFSACNFSTHDGRPDINEDILITEKVPCPCRHRCTLGYCNYDSDLSNREIQVLKLFAQGFDEQSIADQLFISKATVHNHITSIYSKLGLSGTSHPDRLLISYAHNNKLL
jgi:DNA-binding CsgD family transcriptional regulator